MNDRIAQELVRVARELIGGIGIGKTIENGKVRVHRYRSSMVVTDLTNAGKRGKRVDEISIYDLDYARDDESKDIIDELDNDIVRARTFDQAKKMVLDTFEAIQEMNPGAAKIQERVLRGVDVTPGDFRKIVINGPHVGIEADFKTFSVRDKDDHFNEPTCIPAIRGGKADIKVFYRWVMDNEAKIKGMTFQEVIQGMSKAGIRYHQYCAVD